MLRRVGASYLWVGPIALLPLAVLYHAVSFSAGLAGGMVHLALVAAGIHQNALKHSDDARALLLGTTLLIIGGSEVWATGASGPQIQPVFRLPYSIRRDSRSDSSSRSLASPPP